MESVLQPANNSGAPWLAGANLTPLIEAETAINTYHTQSVRDLAQACFSPPLLRVERLEQPAASAAVSDARFELTAARRQWLQNLDRDPTPLLDHLRAHQSRRLGLYFETLWHFFLAQDTQTDLIAHNLPVRAQGRTLGEFDCIYFCHTRQRFVHLELALKYFLGLQTDTVRWYGPNSRDRLDLKLQHMLTHQTQLGQAAPARAVLEQHGIDELDREIALHGYLFQPARHLPSPVGVAPDYRFGRWIKRRDLDAFLPTLRAPHYLVLPRLRWLGPAVLHADDDTLQAAGLAAAVNACQPTGFRPRLVAALNDEGRETARFFVVSNNWPQA